MFQQHQPSPGYPPPSSLPANSSVDNQPHTIGGTGGLINGYGASVANTLSGPPKYGNLPYSSGPQPLPVTNTLSASEGMFRPPLVSGVHRSQGAAPATVQPSGSGMGYVPSPGPMPPGGTGPGNLGSVPAAPPAFSNGLLAAPYVGGDGRRGVPRPTGLGSIQDSNRATIAPPVPASGGYPSYPASPTPDTAAKSGAVTGYPYEHRSFPPTHGPVHASGQLLSGTGARGQPMPASGASFQPDVDSVIQTRAGPEYIQCTLDRVPNSVSLKQKAHVPVGLILRPLAPSDKEVLDVSFGSTGKVIRCYRCRTYINPFTTWDAAGRRWTCNMCGTVNDCPAHYCCPLDESGRRADAGQRPELSQGTVEFIAPGDYMVRPPQPATYLFLIDVTAAAVASGLVATVCQGIKSALNTGRIPGGARTQIGIMTFDSSVHFYRLDPQSSQPHMVVVPALSDVFVPLPDGVLVNLSESETLIRTLLDTLPSMWGHQRVTESCLGTALMAAQTAMKSVGGKLSVFFSSLPTLGDLTLSAHRDGSGRHGNAKAGADDAAAAEVALLKPFNESYQQLGTTMTQAQICVDLYVCPPAAPSTGGAFQGQQPQGAGQQPSGSSVNFSSMDIATLAPLARVTSGELRYYPGFNAVLSGDKLREELVHVLTRNTGWEAVMRIRVSRGWKITNWTGHFYFRHSDLLVLPNCHTDQTFGVQLELEENVVHDPFLYAQSALLYTNSAGERRIRVHTYSVPVTQVLGELTASVNEKAVLTILTYQAIEQVVSNGEAKGKILLVGHFFDALVFCGRQQARKTNLSDARKHLQTACSQMHMSRQNPSIAGSGFGLTRPAPDGQQSGLGSQSLGHADASWSLPYFILGLLKSAAFRDARDVTPDLRTFYWQRLTSLPLDQVVRFAAPRMYGLHDMQPEHGTADAHQKTVLPPPLGLSSAYMSQNGVYLVEDGESMMLWVGRCVEPSWLIDVFGIDDLTNIHSDHAESVIGATGKNLGLRVAAILQAVRQSSLPHMKLTLIRQGSPAEYKFFYALIEDKTHACMFTYEEFLQKLGVRSAPLGQIPGPGGASAEIPSMVPGLSQGYSAGVSPGKTHYMGPGTSSVGGTFGAPLGTPLHHRPPPHAQAPASAAQYSLPAGAVGSSPAPPITGTRPPPPPLYGSNTSAPFPGNTAVPSGPSAFVATPPSSGPPQTQSDPSRIQGPSALLPRPPVAGTAPHTAPIPPLTGGPARESGSYPPPTLFGGAPAAVPTQYAPTGFSAYGRPPSAHGGQPRLPPPMS